jgi:hypothetical protein
MQPNLENMSQRELRAYVIAHPKDNEAFHLWADRATATTPKVFYPRLTQDNLQDAERIIREHIEAKTPGFLAEREANSQPCDRTLLKTMTRRELRAYIIDHPKDTEAFHLYIDTIKPNAQSYPPVNSVEEMERLIQEIFDERDADKDS